MNPVLYCIIISIIEVAIVFLYTHQIFSSKISNTHEFLLLLGTCIIFSLVYRKHLPFLSAAVFGGCVFVCLLIAFRISIAYALYHAALISACMLSGKIIGSVALFYAAHDFWLQPHSFRNMMICMIFKEIISFFIILVVALFLKRNREAPKTSSYGHFLLAASSAISVFFLFTLVFVCAHTKPNPHLDWTIIIPALCVVAVNLFLFEFYFFWQNKALELAATKLHLKKADLEILYHDTLTKENESRQILIHDIRKHLHAIYDMNKKGNTQALSDYIEELVSFSNVNRTIQVCDNHLLNIILSSYILRCEELHIHFHTDIRHSSLSFLTDYDITALFCNLLDNAVAAARDLSDAEISLSVVYNSSLSMTLISLINSCSHKPPENRPGHFLTEKTDRSQHGYGLKSVEHITKKYHGEMHPYYEEEEQMFHTVITLYANEIF